MREYGWDLMDIKMTIRYGGKEYHIDLVLLKRGYWLGPDQGGRYVNALSLINFYACGGQCDRIQDRIMGELHAIMNNLESLLRFYNADFGIVGLVIVDPTTGTGDGGLQGIFNQIELALIANGNPENAAVFMVWTDSSGQLWFACFGQGCNQMTDSQRRREACRMAGKKAGCGAREWVRNNEGVPPPPKEGEDPGPIDWTP